MSNQSAVVNINTGTEKELISIIHIGPVRAKHIISNRPYKDLYELSTIPGLGKTKIDSIIQEGKAHV
jgi:DNA uptake protein ComE-like DNA-binding protein